jgi:hypothetical protein
MNEANQNGAARRNDEGQIRREGEKYQSEGFGKKKNLDLA